LHRAAAERDRSCGEATVRIALHERIGDVVGRAACATGGRGLDRPVGEPEATTGGGDEAIHGEIAGGAHWLVAASPEPDVLGSHHEGISCRGVHGPARVPVDEATSMTLGGIAAPEVPPTKTPPSVFTCACPARLVAPLTVSCVRVTGPARNPPVASRCTSVLGTLSDVPAAGVTGDQAVPFHVST